jgi:hypothetical protein
MMSPKEKEQFNRMRLALLRINKAYETPSQLRKSANKTFGLGYEEVLEMAYENVKNEASSAVKGIKEAK